VSAAGERRRAVRGERKGLRRRERGKRTNDLYLGKKNGSKQEEEKAGRQKRMRTMSDQKQPLQWGQGRRIRRTG
jgi:hypothetical protein